VSTKIWNAFRLRRGFDLWEVMTEIQERGRKRATATLAKFMWGLTENPANASAFGLILKLEADKSELARVMEISRATFLAYREQIGKSERNVFDLDVSVAVHKVGRRYLFRPFSGSGLLSSTLAFMAKMPALEDYHYQNSSDRPEEIGARAWAARAATWDRAMYPNWNWRPFLALDVVSVNGWHEIDPGAELMRKAFIAANQAKKPSP